MTAGFAEATRVQESVLGKFCHAKLDRTAVPQGVIHVLVFQLLLRAQLKVPIVHGPRVATQRQPVKFRIPLLSAPRFLGVSGRPSPPRKIPLLQAKPTQPAFPVMLIAQTPQIYIWLTNHCLGKRAL